MAKYEYSGKKPEISEKSWVHETAQIIGDVKIGEDCFIGPGAALRGDFGSIRVGDRSSVQESCVMHSRPGRECSVGNDSTVGHGAILHGCVIGNRVVVGMNSTVSDDTVIADDCIVAEGSVVRSGGKFPPGVLIAGNPAEVKGPLKDTQKMLKDAGTNAYVELTRNYLKTAREIVE